MVSCCVSALVIPDENYGELCSQFEDLKKEWGVAAKIKGRDLNEKEIASVIQMLNKL